MHPWEWPEHPWKRIHIDYAGPFLGKMFLLVIDAHSRWMEIEAVHSATTQSTLEHLRSMFARFGLPEVMVTDNGTCFTSSEFAEFSRRNQIRHVKVAPYHPSSNGLAERAVQTFKLGMKKQTSGTMQTKLSHFLFHHRLTPNSTTGVAPAELMQKCKTRSHLDAILPSVKRNVEQQQQRQNSQHDTHTKVRVFKEDDLVLVQNLGHTSGPNWLPGVIIKCCGSNSYQIQIDNNQVVRRHADHIITRQTDCDVPNMIDDDDVDTLPLPATSSDATNSSALRRSQRTRRPPDRFKT